MSLTSTLFKLARLSADVRALRTPASAEVGGQRKQVLHHAEILAN